LCVYFFETRKSKTGLVLSPELTTYAMILIGCCTQTWNLTGSFLRCPTT